MPNIAVYIDGHNLYHSIKRSGEPLLWADYWKMGLHLCRSTKIPGQALVYINYYTAIPEHDKTRKERHEKFISAALACAASAGGTLNVCKGFFQTTPNGGECCCGRPPCKCGHTWNVRQEKQGDTGLCTDLICDAYSGRYDAAIVVTNDSDMAPAMAVVNAMPDKKVFLAYPPRNEKNSKSDTLEKVCEFSFRTIEPLRDSQMGGKVKCLDGSEVECPDGWL